MAEETLSSGTELHEHRYRIERVLGSGGFGHVYLAIDLATNHQYALKEYLVTGASGQEQLKHEATVLSQLHHPNLPAFQDAFMERGHYYVVLNYIEGSDLTDLIRSARQRNDIVPIARIMSWLLAICDAVHFLHSQRTPVIHRDIKPDNIRITPNGTATLVDLGNAKAAADGARTLFFIRHQGTPGYAPPEQYPGGAGTDMRSDVYALGGTLYFALTAHEPPSVSIRNESISRGRPDLPSLQDVLANNPPEESPEANAARQFRLGVTKPSKPAPRHLRQVAQLGSIPPDLLDQLNRIIQRAMDLKPRDRYPSIEDLANDLRKVAGKLSPPTQPPSPRRIDPHSTQPDLPKVYDALQAAKEIADTSTAPIADNTSGTCPRCNAPLLTNASYCSRCGRALPPSPKNSFTNIEDTMFIRPQTPVAVGPSAQVMAQSKIEAARAVFTPTATQASPIMPLASGHQAISPPQQPSTKMDSTPSSRPGPKTIIFTLVILAVLVTMIALFVFISR